MEGLHLFKKIDKYKSEELVQIWGKKSQDETFVTLCPENEAPVLQSWSLTGSQQQRFIFRLSLDYSYRWLQTPSVRIPFANTRTAESVPTSACVRAKLLQVCLTLCNPMDCSLPGSSVPGILQERIPEGLPCLPPGDLPNLCLLHCRGILYHWTT